MLAREMTFDLKRPFHGEILFVDPMQYGGVRVSNIEEDLDFRNITRVDCPCRYAMNIYESHHRFRYTCNPRAIKSRGKPTQPRCIGGFGFWLYFGRCCALKVQ